MSANATAPICCAKCGQPVKVVCDAHGTDCVLDLTGDAVPVNVRKAEPAPVSGLRSGSVRERIALLCNSVRDDAGAIRTCDVASTLGISAAHASVELTYLVNQHIVRRVRRGYFAAASDV